MQQRGCKEDASDRDQRDRRDPCPVERAVGDLVGDEASAGRQEREPEEQLDEVGGVSFHHLAPKILSTPPGSKRPTRTWPAPTRRLSTSTPGPLPAATRWAFSGQPPEP